MHYKRSLIEVQNTLLVMTKVDITLSPQLTGFRFEEEKYAELAYHIYNSVYGTPLSDIIKYTFRILNIDRTTNSII